MKTLMVVLLLGVLAALASAGVFMMRRGRDGNTPDTAEGRNKYMARALAVRVGLSVLLFVLVLLSWAMGWVQPTGLPTGR
ncbi:hypothetical protein D621_08270 [beta proteobacterium AAP51]|nr:hypothetical protein D621_08270 [beta proteobacterium AAP51]